jgi:NAD-dependent DNA ligase
MAKKEKFVPFDGSDPIKSKIRRRRAQMLIHSCIYYEMDASIISDDQWQQWADELEVLQKENPKYMKIDFFDREFKDWDGTTGSHLPHRYPWVYAKSKYILDIQQRIK